ncbi:hypothetical protein E5676_scaffold970G00020 [Cucumis melo var. makuwa]|uniref:Ty3-gypsy retrotransposon protein n=1 Tax=Cucumis melo var. makuwa TaxID=1194695 RepID=A0A5A7UVT8_CUCMM|nr:hypothetical protein E6C27_scaffold126G00140 [Cucumis melo var. makuwa]TYK27457.1 hypothetical protein E5676_scaffold970G00020 [Cucumis melo var. makuwa]
MQPDAAVQPSSDSVCRRLAAFRRAVRQAAVDEPPTIVDLLSCEPTREPSSKPTRSVNSSPTRDSSNKSELSVDPLSVNSNEGHNQVSGKGFPTTGPRIEAGNVVIHKGLHISNVTASCSLCAIGCKELFTDRHQCPDVLSIVVMLMGYVVDWNCMSMDFKVLRLDVFFGITRLIRASFEITRLICVSFGIIRLICVSLGITRLIGVSFGITRLIRASFGITGLMCKGTTRGRPTRGKKDA